MTSRIGASAAKVNHESQGEASTSGQANDRFNRRISQCGSDGKAPDRPPLVQSTPLLSKTTAAAVTQINSIAGAAISSPLKLTSENPPQTQTTKAAQSGQLVLGSVAVLPTPPVIPALPLHLAYVSGSKSSSLPLTAAVSVTPGGGSANRPVDAKSQEEEDFFGDSVRSRDRRSSQPNLLWYELDSSEDEFSSRAAQGGFLPTPRDRELSATSSTDAIKRRGSNFSVAGTTTSVDHKSTEASEREEHDLLIEIMKFIEPHLKKNVPMTPAEGRLFSEFFIKTPSLTQFIKKLDDIAKNIGTVHFATELLEVLDKTVFPKTSMTSLVPDRRASLMLKIICGLSEEGVIKLVLYMMEKQVKNATTLLEFRNNNLTSRVITLFQNRLLYVCEGELNELLEGIPSKSYDIKMVGDCAQLLKKVDEILKKIVLISASRKFPSKIKELTVAFHDAINKKFDGKGKEMAPQLFFLRFLSPLLTNGNPQFKIPREKIKAGIQLSKAIQTLANGTNPDKPEQDFQYINAQLVELKVAPNKKEILPNPYRMLLIQIMKNLGVEL